MAQGQRRLGDSGPHHDINWWVAVATLIYVGLQGYVLVRDKLVHRPHPDKEPGEVPHA
ncbi:hypothetical protein [Paraburkholderia terrae]